MIFGFRKSKARVLSGKLYLFTFMSYLYSNSCENSIAHFMQNKAVQCMHNVHTYFLHFADIFLILGEELLQKSKYL